MGGITSRDTGVEEVDSVSTNAYRYPPKIGNYFGSHFIMGGERFEMSQPEAYLFGENSDLNFLGNKPIPFPYSSTSGNEPTKPLKSLVNIRKDSLKFVKVEDTEDTGEDETDNHGTRYNIEFTFDCDSKCAITIYYFATEDVNNGQIVYTNMVDPTLNSETYHYKRGSNQLFSQPSHIIDPNKYSDDEWQYDCNKETFPIVISCVVEDDDHPCHSHITYAVVEKSSVDGGYMIKALKQKQFVDGLLYLLQEIYGIENKQTDRSKLEDPDDDIEDSGAECVICMSDMRDTLILPCRHLCLCSTCAESLRYQASSCPICRSPFRALLQIRAMRRKQQLPVQTGENGEENPVSQEGVPAGYEAVSLIEAVNGPCNQLFTVDGGFNLPVRIPPGEIDSSYREKKRLSKRHMISVKPEDTVVSANVKPDDVKKVLDEEEEERKKDMPVEVVRMEGKLSKKDINNVKYSDSKEISDDSNVSKIVNVSEDYNTDSIDSKDLRKSKTELRVYESEADSDYDLKPIQRIQGQNSTENLADDEREDSSDPEPEPEPDYEDDVSTGAVKAESTPDISDGVESTDFEDSSVTYVKGLSLSMSDVNRDSDGYHPLRIGSNVSLPENSTSGTEASSFGSTHSSGKLLPDGTTSDDDKL